jgi:site-specific DNA-cytosine methylase
MRIIGVCSGNGVSLFPFKEDIVLAIEPRAKFKFKNNEQWKLNFNSIPLYTQVCFPVAKNITAIIGHPNCGNTSNLAYSRAKRQKNPLGDITVDFFIRAINFYKPKVFFFENLPKLLHYLPKEKLLELWPNYNLLITCGSVAKWGNSQISRERLVIIGFRKNLMPGILECAKSFKIPKYELKTTQELLQGLTYPDEKLCHIREPFNTIVCMEKDYQKLTLAQVKTIWNTELKGKKRWDATTTGKGNMKNLPGVYRNLAKDLPLTVREQLRQFNPDGEVLTPREIARIQGIPDDFKLWYEPTKAKYCLNKARITCAKGPPYELLNYFKALLTYLDNQNLLKNYKQLNS